MKRFFYPIALFSLLLIVCVLPASAQMPVGQDTLYGNEWIDHDKTYYKVKVAHDGVYRIPFEAMLAAGMPGGDLVGDRLQMFFLGKEVPLWVSEPGQMQAGDVVEFVGEKNRSQVDQYLFSNPDGDMLNPYYSFFSDTSAYYLSLVDAGENVSRYRDVPADDLSGQRISSFPDTYRRVFNEGSFQYRLYQDLVVLSNFDKGEGYASRERRRYTFILNVPDPDPSGNGGDLRMRVATQSGNHDLVVRINGVEVYEKFMGDFSLEDLVIPLSQSDLLDPIEVELEGREGNADQYAVGFAEVRYDRMASMASDSLLLAHLEPDNDRRILQLSGGNQAPVLYNDSELTRQEAVSDAGNWLLGIEGGVDAELTIFDPGKGVFAVDVLHPQVFSDYSDLDGEFIIISHPMLIQSDERVVQEYADYRSSEAGGGFRVAIIDVEQLYGQFAYGIDQHSIAIRNFGHLIKKEWTDPQQVFLIGRGYEYVYARNPAEPYRAGNLVPTFGTFGSDQLLLSTNATSAPIISMGRLSARTPQDVSNYLEKVKLHESGFGEQRNIENFAWRKRALHLVGGKSDEQNRFGALLHNLGNTLVQNEFGAEVTAVTKVGSEAISSSVSEAVINAVNEGVAIKTFLGHGAVPSTEFGMDDPELFDNEGKYMLAFSLGCLSGNMYTPQNSVSEKFVLNPTKGSIGYVASVAFSSPSNLIEFTDQFYEQVGGEMYGETVGDILKTVRESIDGIPSTLYRSLNQQLSYHGDPSVRINSVAAPDFLPDYASVIVGPDIITSITDSVDVSFSLVNIGSVSGDTVVYELKHTSPGGNEFTYRDSVQLMNSFTDVHLRIPLQGDQLIGLNQVRITVDPDNAIEEMPSPAAEGNNALQGPGNEDFVSFFVAENAVQPVFPPEFSIIDPSSPELIASAADLFAQANTFEFELDTTAMFDSPMLVQAEVEGRGSRIAWQSGQSLQSGLVYYWRVRTKPSAGTEDNISWSGSSFLALNEAKEGWNQSHFYQWAENGFEDIVADTTDHKLRFRDRPIGMVGDAVKQSSTNLDRSRGFYDNTRIYKAPSYLGRNISFMVADPTTGQYWVNRGSGDYGSERPSNDQRNGYTFGLHTQAERAKVINFLENVVPEGHIVVLFTFHTENRSFMPETWADDSLTLGTNLFQVLEKQGAVRVRELETVGTRPYAFAYRKGIEAVDEALGGPNDERVNVLLNFNARVGRGAVITDPIGPALSWREIQLARGEGFGDASPDSLSIALYGLTEVGSSPDLLATYIDMEDVDISHIDAAEYPFLFLRYYISDPDDREVPAMEHWRIYYEGSPELALDPVAFHADTLDRGELLTLDLAIHNFSAVSSDSLTLRYLVVDAMNNAREEIVRVGPVPARDSIRVSFEYPTDALQGRQQLIAEMIPDGPGDRSIFNNQARRPFFVIGDQVSPLLDVTFDGLHIMDGDLVSAQPLIHMRLGDENTFQQIDDTASFTIRLTGPTGAVEELEMDDPRIQFFPAEPGGKNEARVEFRPVWVEDGEYELAVNARDNSGNVSGIFDYTVRFEVITTSAISNVLPYPNPFTTATRFVYTMTGGMQPDFFMIQIFNASGQVVREVTKEEFGVMRIGTHQSDFVWDGRDDFGDRLANGVYFYRVVTRDAEGEDFEHRSVGGIDKYFRRDIGKIVILR